MLTLCGGCLAPDRTLKPVTKHFEALNWIIGRKPTRLNKHIARIRFCWECSCLLKKLNDFRFKVNIAQSLLERKLKGEQVDLTPLSNLNETIIKTEYDYLLTQDDKNTVPIVKEEFDDSDYHDTNYDHFEYKSDFSDSEKVEDFEDDIKIEEGSVKIVWDETDGIGKIVDKSGHLTDETGNICLFSHDNARNSKRNVTISDKIGSLMHKNTIQDDVIDKRKDILGKDITISKRRIHETTKCSKLSNSITIRDKKGNILDKSNNIVSQNITISKDTVNNSNIANITIKDKEGNIIGKNICDISIAKSVNIKTLKDDNGNNAELNIKEVKIEFDQDRPVYKRKSSKGQKQQRKCKIIHSKPIKGRELLEHIIIEHADFELSKKWIQMRRNSEPFVSSFYKCVYCMLMFGRECAVEYHNKRRHLTAGTDYICDVCDRGFNNKSSLKQHIKTHKFKYTCKLCNEEFFLMTSITSHLRRHSIRFQCPCCKLQFEWQRDFYQHYKALHQTFKCDYCGKVTRIKKTLERHMLEHTKTHCKICNVQFRSFRGYINHYNMLHLKSEEESAYCVECDMRFDNMNRYRYHLRTAVKHVGKQTGKYPCPACNNVYAKKLTMKYHYNYYHLKKTKFYCQICDRYMLNGFRLRQHIASVHEKIKMPKNKFCDICGRGFATRRILTNHRRTHTGERPYQCEHCSAAFAQRSAMTTHVKSQHKQFVQI